MKRHAPIKRRRRALSRSLSPRVEIMCGDADDLETLRFRRDLAARDGDLAHALKVQILIDKKRFANRKH